MSSEEDKTNKPQPIPRRVDRADYYSADANTLDTPASHEASDSKRNESKPQKVQSGGGSSGTPPVSATSGGGGSWDSEKVIGFLDHLEELRWRLIRILLGVVVAGSAALFFGDEIFVFVLKPLDGLKLHVTTVTGSFYAYMVVSIFAGLFAIIPYVFYQLWAFVAPGLYKSEKTFILPAVMSSSLLFAFGSWFCYRFVLPVAITYLVSFGDGALTPIITVDSYLTFAGMMVLSFGAAFNMPVVSFFLAKMNLLKPDMLPKSRRVAVVVILIFAAIITPPDVFTQILIGAPMYVLFEISIIVVRIANPSSGKSLG